MTERKAVESADEMGQESAGMLDSEPSEMLRSRVHGPQDRERIRAEGTMYEEPLTWGVRANHK